MQQNWNFETLALKDWWKVISKSVTPLSRLLDAICSEANDSRFWSFQWNHRLYFLIKIETESRVKDIKCNSISKYNDICGPTRSSWKWKEVDRCLCVSESRLPEDLGGSRVLCCLCRQSAEILRRAKYYIYSIKTNEYHSQHWCHCDETLIKIGFIANEDLVKLFLTLFHPCIHLRADEISLRRN